MKPPYASVSVFTNWVYLPGRNKLKRLTQLQALRKPSEALLAAVVTLWPGLGCQEEG